MKLTCPACNETLSLAALIEHDAAREAIGTALKMPAPLGKYLLQYLGFFKPAKSTLSLDKVARIFSELLPMISSGKVSKNGTAYAAPQEYWAQAIETMVANRAALTLPLKSHGYLISIIAGYAEKIAAKKETEAEKGRQYGAVKTSPVIASAAQQSTAPDHIPDAKKMVTDQFADTGKVIEKTPRKAMPASLKATLEKMTGKPSHAE